MRKIIGFLLVSAVFITLAAGSAFAALSSAKYYMVERDAYVTVVNDGKTQEFIVKNVQYVDDLVRKISSQTGVKESDVEAVLVKVSAPSVWDSVWYWGIIGAVILFVVITFFSMAYTVEHQTNAVIERFRKFSRIAKPGLKFKIPYIERVAKIMNLRVQELKLKIESKTADDVFAELEIAVQYFVQHDKVYDAYYRLEDPTKQMESYVYDVVRARVPKLKIDEVFERKDDIANAVKESLTEVMTEYGYGIKATLVNDIVPDKKVKETMNEVNAQERLRKAAEHKGEAEKTITVKAAEAQMESKRLQGEGIAKQRLAIVRGLQESVEAFQAGVPGSTPEDVMRLVLMTQYLDTLKEIGANSRTNTLMLSHAPSSLRILEEQIRDGILSAELATDKDGKTGHSARGKEIHPSA